MRALSRILVKIVFLISILTLNIACKTARYQIVGLEQVKGTEPPLPPCEDCTVNHEPSADLEAIFENKSVTNIPVGQAIILRPTLDTLDPDDFGKEASCQLNPGIISAKYTQAETTIDETISRTACENLGIEHTFTEAGLYFIELEVTSNDDEKALASMTLAVYNPSNQQDPSKGFDIQANPMVSDIGKEIILTSNCELNHKATTAWSFGDGEKASGAEVKHSYAVNGSYEVSATCKDMRAGLTLSILEKDHKVDLEQAPIKKPGGNPDGTNPNQNGPGQNNPNQNNPTQTGT